MAKCNHVNHQTRRQDDAVIYGSLHGLGQGHSHKQKRDKSNDCRMQKHH